jgi:hypothetical protein
VPSAGEVHRKRPRGYLRWSPAPVGRQAQELHVFIDVRKLRLDPFPHRSRGRSWPRALPRLLQIDVSTSTTMDRPNIPDQRSPWAGTAAAIDRFLSIEDNRRRCAGSGAEDHRASTFLPGLLPEETSPQPRSLQTPRVAGIARRPVRSGRGKRAMPPALRALARHAQREGRATPALREKNRRSPTRGAFRRKAVRKRGDLRLA